MQNRQTEKVLTKQVTVMTEKQQQHANLMQVMQELQRAGSACVASGRH